jgi:hypothetical protein
MAGPQKRETRRDEHEKSIEQHINEEQPGKEYQHEKGDYFFGCFYQHVCPGRRAQRTGRTVLTCKLEGRVWIFGQSHFRPGRNTFYSPWSLEVRREGQFH